MNKRLFERLAESMTQHNEIARGERAPHGHRHIGAADVADLIDAHAAVETTPDSEIQNREQAEIVRQDENDVHLLRPHPPTTHQHKKTHDPFHRHQTLSWGSGFHSTQALN